jgi:acyl carrier protein
VGHLGAGTDIEIQDREDAMFSKEQFRDAMIEGIKRVRDDENFSDVGLDSLDGMNLVLEVETLLGINLGEFDLKGAGTINDFYTKAKEAVSKQ